MYDEPIISACSLGGVVVSSSILGDEINSNVFTSQLMAHAETSGGSGSPAPTGEHNDLTGRDELDCHPQSAISGLTSALSGKADIDSLATVATSGSYNDLSDQPTIPTDVSDLTDNTDIIPTNTSDLNNDSNFVSDANYVHTDNNYSDSEKARVTVLENLNNICKTITYYDDFFGRASNAASVTLNPTGLVFATTGGTFRYSTTIADVGRRGVLSMATGTSTNTNMGAVNYLCMLLQDGSTIVATSLKTPSSLSFAAQRYIVMTGLMDDIAASANHCRFVYSDDLNGGNWQLQTYSGGSGNVVDSGVTVVADTWYKLHIIINSDATEAKYYINNNLVATVVNNIPSATVTHFMTVMNKTAGSSPRVLYVDYHYLQQILNTDRC